MNFSGLQTPEEIPIKNIYVFYRKYFYVRYLNQLNPFYKDVENHFLDYHYGIGFVRFNKKLYKDLYIDYFYHNPYNIIDKFFFDSQHYYLFDNNLLDSYILRLPRIFVNKYTTRKTFDNLDPFYENNFRESQISPYFYQFRVSYFYQNYSLKFIFNENQMLLTIFRSVFFKNKEIIVNKNQMHFLKINDYQITLNQLHYNPRLFPNIHSYIWNPYLL